MSDAPKPWHRSIGDAIGKLTEDFHGEPSGQPAKHPFEICGLGTAVRGPNKTPSKMEEGASGSDAPSCAAAQGGQWLQRGVTAGAHVRPGFTAVASPPLPPPPPPPPPRKPKEPEGAGSSAPPVPPTDGR
eukprot:6501120-Prymnesium_polylepis.1